jgi:hypothetical protein
VPAEICYVPGQPPGTIPPGREFSTIQAAINDLACIEIVVLPGTYVERLDIGRGVHLHGLDGWGESIVRSTVGAAGCPPTIFVHDIETIDVGISENVCVEGLTIEQVGQCPGDSQCCGFGPGRRALILEGVHRSRFSNNLIRGGVWIQDSAWNEIYQNTFEPQVQNAIFPEAVFLFSDSRENDIFCNEYSNGPGAGGIWSDETSKRNQVFRNNFRQNQFTSLFDGSPLFPVSDQTISIDDPNGLNLWQDGACKKYFWHGPCQGNYWADYLNPLGAAGFPPGIDRDGETVGDTEVPFQDVDFYPLMEAVDITTCPPNIPPTCTIAPILPLTCDGTNIVHVDGCGSIDPDGGPKDLTYCWTVDPPVGIFDCIDTCAADIALPSPGDYTFFFSVQDGQDICSQKVNVTLKDCEPPTIKDCGTRTLECTLPGQGVLDADWAPNLVADNCSAPGAFTLGWRFSGSPDPPTPGPVGVGTIFNLGTTFIDFVVTDEAGNSATCTTIVIVEDTIAPTPNYCLQRVGCIRYATGAPQQAQLPIYSLIGIGSADDCDPAPTCSAVITQLTPPGGVFTCCPSTQQGVPSWATGTAPDDGRHCVIPVTPGDTFALYNTCWPAPIPPPGTWPGLGLDDCANGDMATGGGCPPGGPPSFTPTISVGGPGLALVVTCTDSSGNVATVTHSFVSFCDPSGCGGSCCSAPASCDNFGMPFGNGC